MPTENREFWLIIISFFLIYFVWGSTYLANAWGIQDVPPFMYAAARFISAGICMFLIARLTGPIVINREQIINTLICGFFFFAIGNGFVVWALLFIDTGISALIISFQPVLVVALMWAWKKEKPNFGVIIGLILGVIGMVFLVGQPDFSTNAQLLKGVLAIFIAMVGWAWVSVWVPTANLPKSIFLSSSLQMFFGGLMLLAISLMLGEYRDFDSSKITTTSVWIFLYLLFFGSIAAFTAFSYLLKKVSPEKVVTSTFVNPVVALFLGWWLNAEQFSSQSIIAAILLLSGVLFINGQMDDLWRWLVGSRKKALK